MNNPPQLNLKSERARKARFGALISAKGERLLGLIAILLAASGAYGLWQQPVPTHLSFVALALAVLAVLFAAWHRYDLARLSVNSGDHGQLDTLLAPEVLARLREPLTPFSLWQSIMGDWRAGFVIHHLLLPANAFSDVLSKDEGAMAGVWQQSLDIATALAAPEINAGILAAALILSSSETRTLLASRKLSEADVREVAGWLERGLASIRKPRAFFGGIGRDWTSGFTPMLERFGEPISRYVEAAGGSVAFTAHGDAADGVVNNLTQGTSVALVGPVGTGKTTLVDLVAERLLSGKARQLQYYRIIKLNASAILSAAAGKLEPLMLHLFSEAVNAGNIILFLDDAHLFFGNGVGAFDMGQLLAPILQNRRLKLIAAFTPDEWQQLRTHNPALASNLAAVVIRESNAPDTVKIVEAAANQLENRHQMLVSYEAVREAIRLSGQYMQEDAYPGKAISLLEQSVPYADQGLMVAKTIQATLEKTRGVHAGASEAPEANILLNLEAYIHQRMINQTHAVSVVAAALRRGRAGVSSPKRPVGSFLFLGPTGVGKTELARSLAAVYFGSERQMIRLDMSEFQSPDDVRRLLATGGDHARSLLLQIREQPFAVVLLDEIEKAHPNILNLLLQLLDEGQLTDELGHVASFRSAIIIATSNAGAIDIAARVKETGNLNDFEQPLLDKLIANGQFKPELVNRFDEVVLFRPLNEQELAQVASLMLQDVNKTLEAQNIRVDLTPAALAFIAREGYQPEFGARPMRHIIQKTVENAVAVRILQGQATPGTTITLDEPDLQAMPS